MNILSVKGDDFFIINHIDVHREAKRSFLDVAVKVKARIDRESLIRTAYFYDSNKKMIATVYGNAIYQSYNAKDSWRYWKYYWPAILPPNKKLFLYFEIPKEVLAKPDWAAVVVFGDSKGVDAQLCEQNTNDVLSQYDYAEKSKLEDKSGLSIDRHLTMDPLVLRTIKTEDPSHPQITLYLRAPLGMTDVTQAKGVLCFCVLAGELSSIARMLRGQDVHEDPWGGGGILKFADDHKLIIICWGSQHLWKGNANWDDLKPDDGRRLDAAFDHMADAWEKGVQGFINDYNIPKNGYLLYGISGSAQFACRLALRKPDYFLAVGMHIPSSFDKPTPEASKVLWCLTTGELEAGHSRSLRFYEQCRKLGYPMIYKAIVGMGHETSSVANDIDARFFEYALTVRDKREVYDQNSANPIIQFQAAQSNNQQGQPWLEAFRKPLFVGDILNQETYPGEQVGMVPTNLRTALPTQDIADAWNETQ